ncbi:hypothetical protein F4861DRAFT_387506 [Xylaria intraflava]|nr:hypothetical protein F4861DRAFT_387506 [Xylaria intraflava]
MTEAADTRSPIFLPSRNRLLTVTMMSKKFMGSFRSRTSDELDSQGIHSSGQSRSTDMLRFRNARKILGWHGAQFIRTPSPQKPFPYWRFPYEIRIKILEFALPQRITCVGSLDYHSGLSDINAPKLLSAFKEWAEEIHKRACYLQFYMNDTKLHKDWWNRQNPIYFPSVHIVRMPFDCFQGQQHVLPGVKLVSWLSVLCDVYLYRDC